MKLPFDDRAEPTALLPSESIRLRVTNNLLCNAHLGKARRVVWSLLRHVHVARVAHGANTARLATWVRLDLSA